MTSMRADFPSEKAPATRVRLQISRLRRSMALLARMRRQCSRGEGRARQGLGEALADDLAASPSRILSSSSATARGLGLGGGARLHRVDRLEHGRDGRTPGLRHAGEHVPVEMHGAALAGGLWEHPCDRFGPAGG